MCDEMQQREGVTYCSISGGFVLFAIINLFSDGGCSLLGEYVSFTICAVILD